MKRLREDVREIRAQLPKEKQGIITYSKNFTLSLSNYCRNNCGYCYYNHRIPKENNTALISEKEVKSILKQAVYYKCKEALLMSGENPDSFKIVKNALDQRNFHCFLDFIRKLCKDLLYYNFLPHTNIGLLTFEEMKDLKEWNASMGLMLESTSGNLFKEGAVHEFSLYKDPKLRIEHIRNAGKLKIPFTTGLLLGIGENLEDRINDLILIKEINDEFHHIQEVILQNFVMKNGICYKPSKPVNLNDILKIVGIARIIFKNDISIQIPPNLVDGHEIEFVTMGVDDFGGISPFTQDYINPEKPWPQINHLETICKERGFQLEERLPIYPRFINKKGFCSESIKKAIDNIN